MKRVMALGATLALLLVPVLARFLEAQSPPPSQAPPPPTFTLTDLGLVQNSGSPGGVTAVNSSGQATGTILDSTGTYQHAFLYQNGSVTDLGSFSSGHVSFGYGINNSGQVVGVAQLSAATAGNTLRAFLWQNGTMANLGDPNVSGLISQAFGINTAGDVAGYEIQSTGFYAPVMWKGGTHAGETFLSTLPCGSPVCNGEALTINDAGQSAGYSATMTGIHPVMWSSAGLATDLGSLGGPITNQANAINANGVVVGYSQLDPAVAPSTVHAFSWTNGTLQDLGTIPGADPLYLGSVVDTNSSAWGINSKGDIVGISGVTQNAATLGSGGRAFLYIPTPAPGTGGTMYDLTSLLAPGTNWHQLQAAWAINDNGQIVGVGIDPNQQQHGFLLTPIITPTTTTVSSSVNPSVFGQQVSFTATVSPTTSSALIPTGTVTFNDGTTVLGTVTLSSGNAIFNTAGLGPGTHTISASYTVDNNFGSSTSTTLNQTVNQAATITSLAASPSPANVGQAVTFTATVTPVAPGAGTPTGTVKFLDGSTTLGTVVMNSAGNATFSSSSLTTGSHSITALYGGDINFAGSVSTNVNQVISQPATSTALAASPNPANVGQTVTFTATVSVIAPGTGMPTGTVSFLDGATTLGTGVLSPLGTATLSTSSLAAGTHSVTASYGGDVTFAGSTSTGVIVAVQGPVQIMVNETVHVTDVESFPDVFDPEKITVTDQVSIQVLNTTTISISAPSVTYATPESVSISVNSPTATVSGNVTLAVDGGPPTTMPLTSHFDPLLELPVGSATFNLGVLPAGNHALMANFAAQGNFLASSAQTTFVVSQATPTITWANPTPLVYGTPLSSTQLDAAASVSGSFVYSPAAGAVLSAGSQTLSATFTPTDMTDYTTAPATVTLVVNKAISTISWATPASIFYPTALSGVQLNAAASVLGSFVYSPPAGTVLSAGAQTLSVAFTPTDATNYTSAAATVSIAVIPPVQIVDNETIHITDAESFPDVFDAEKITVTDQVSVIPCDFTVSASSPMNVPVGGSGSTPITITSVNSCNLQVSLSASSVPLGVSISLPGTVSTGGSSTSAALTVGAGPNVTPTSFSVTITGISGLTHSVSVSVNITASISGTIGVVQTLANAGAIDNSGVAGALTSKLSAAQSAPNAQTSINTLKAFQNQVQAQAGKHIATSFTLAGVTFNPASALMGNGQALIDSLRVSMIPDPITGYVVNSSGIAVPGAIVSIADATGNIVASATSDATGFYYMATTGVLTPGATYTLAVTGLPAGFASASPANQPFTWQGVAVSFSNFVLN